MMDFYIWPWIERLGMCKELCGGEDMLTKEKFPNLHSLYVTMLEEPAVKATIISPEKHTQFFKSVTSGGEIKYDLLLTE